MFCPAPGHAGLKTQSPSSSPPKGRAEHRAFHRARGATWVTTWHHVLSRHMTPCTGGTAHGKLPCGSGLGSRKRLRSARDGFDRLATPSGTTTPGALTECWASPHCWVLGPPTSSAGRGPFTTLRVAHLTARPARKAHRRDGSVASRSAPVMLPARLFAGEGWTMNIPGRPASSS